MNLFVNCFKRLNLFLNCFNGALCSFLASAHGDEQRSRDKATLTALIEGSETK